jgi:hypothetical protein
MPVPGFVAEAAVYSSTHHYRSALPSPQAIGRIRIVRQLTPQDQQCSTATVIQCLADAENVYQNELAACDDLRTAQQRAHCRAVAGQDYNAAIAKCDPCPTGSRCESNVCCPSDQATCAPNCTFRNDQTTFSLTYNVSQGGLLLARQITFDRLAQNSSDRILITQGADSLISMASQLSSTDLRTTCDYGPMFTGIQHATVLSSDGNTFVEIVDGRQTVPFSATTDFSTIRFVDGGALPAVGSTTPGLIDQVVALLRTAQAVPPGCTGAGTAKAGVGPFEPFPGCDLCKLGCAAKAGACGTLGIGVTHWICKLIPLPFVGQIVCQVGAEYAEWLLCIQATKDCSDACEAPGHACCPVACTGNRCCGVGDVCCGEATAANSGCCSPEECCTVRREGMEEKFCCFAGNVCVDPNNGICCPADHGPVCANTCCPTGNTCVDPVTGLCCPADHGPVCGNTCCPAGYSCADPATRLCCPPGTRACGVSSVSCCPIDLPCIGGECCPNIDDKNCGDGFCCPKDDPCIDNLCCSFPSRDCGDGVCCPGFNECCGGRCCIDIGQSCNRTLGTCCDRALQCGPKCCANGQFCKDKNNGICEECGRDGQACFGPVGVPNCCGARTECCANGQCCPIDPTSDFPKGTCCCATETGWECRSRDDKCCTPR